MDSKHDLNLAVIGNCSLSALIDTHGVIVFSCLPYFDSDPMFCDLIAGKEIDYGYWAIELQDCITTEQYYERNTPILVTRLHSADSILEIIDFAPRFTLYDRVFHPTELVRILNPISGHPRITIKCRPASNYGEFACEKIRGSNHLVFKGTDFNARLTSDAPISFIENEIPFIVSSQLGLLFGPDESLTRSPQSIYREFYEMTKLYWMHWTKSLKIPFEWQVAVIRSAITLKLCSFEESGAIVAALTTSIPESPNSGRNWDYRYCWLRDSFHTVRALNYLGATETMEGYMHFILNIVAHAVKTSGDLQPLYGILMQTKITESIVHHLSGYRSMGPVRIGNDAYHQLQNDNYGSVVLALCQMFFDERVDNPASNDLFLLLEYLGELAIKCYNVPDAGLWELRGSLRIHTFSSVMCWAACDRLSKIALKLHLTSRFDYWHRWAHDMREFILKYGYDEEQQTFVAVIQSETKDVDAALLLLAELGFISGTDKRFVSTVERIERQLKIGDFLYRYTEEDDFGRPDNAFTICTFWYISALTMMGRTEEARTLFEKLLTYTNHVGLLSEDMDMVTKELWGNFPQTYSLVGIINCAIRLSTDWTEAGLC